MKYSGKQTWGYVEVRPGANMFWWLYYTTATVDYTKRPLIMWLQGGPGASSAGFGNFMEVGPLDVNLKNRSYSWVNYANVLFVDNPVGAGFSYVNDTKLLCKNNSQITADLITLMDEFLQKVPEFQDVPLYIFSESYGGKMAAQLTLRLYKRILAKKIKCNLKGVNLGDSWISPEDSVLTWAPFLFSTSLVDNAGFAAINASAYHAKEAIAKGQFVEATDLFDKTETIIGQYTNGVNVYNIMKFDKSGVTSPSLKDSKEKKDSKIEYPKVDKILSSIFGHTGVPLGEASDETNQELKIEQKWNSKMTHLGKKWLSNFHDDKLTQLMNGQIKNMLRVVPKNITWGAQSDAVFKALAGDFMKPVVNIVESLLNTPLYINVYSGQLDMIVDTMGKLKNKLTLSKGPLVTWEMKESWLIFNLG